MTALVLLLLSAPVAEPVAEPLVLDEVLAAVARHHPTAAILDAEVRVAQAGRVEARGGFDLMLDGQGWVGTEGDSRRAAGKHMAAADLRQPLPLLGRPTLSLGYALDPYADFDETSQIGAVDAKLSLELWRDGLVDADRAKLQTARLKVAASRAARAGGLLSLESAAAAAYWDWVARGWALEIARDLEARALERQAAVEAQVRGGNLAAIEAVDNRRTVLARHERVVAAELSLRAASLKLGVFLRDPLGEVAPPSAERLPPMPGRIFGPMESGGVAGLIQAARAAHPALLKIDREIEALEIGLSLARNDARPQVQVALGIRQDFEAAKGDGRELKAGLKVALPLQRRRAHGRAGALRARLGALEQARRLRGDQLAVEIEQAWAALRASRARARLADDAWRAAQAVERAESRRVALGDSEILRLNLREQATADSALRRALAAAEVERQRARLRLASGKRIEAGSLDRIWTKKR